MLFLPTLANAAGLDWSAFDLKNCKKWYFDIGLDPDASNQLTEKYKERPVQYQPDGKLIAIKAVLESSDDPNDPANQYFAECLISNNGTLQCNGYGKNGFPLGNARYKLKSSKSAIDTYTCVSGCAETPIKYVYDHGWESELDYSPEYKAQRKAALRNCGKQAERW